MINIFPLASRPSCALSGFPFTTLLTPVCCPLAPEALSFIHSFIPSIEQCSRSLFGEKDNSHHPRSYTTLWQQKADNPNQWLDPKTYGIQDKDNTRDIIPV